MSRHRNVRSLDVHEEYDGYDEVYGHSVEDDYCVSPSTAAQFMYDRSQQHVLSTFMSREPQIPEEEEGENESDEDSMNDSSSFSKPHLTDMQQAKLFSCLEQLRSVLGDSTPDHVLTNAVIKADFSYEKALSEILDQQDAPKPQREPRNRRQRDEYDNPSDPLDTDYSGTSNMNQATGRNIPSSFRSSTKAMSFSDINPADSRSKTVSTDIRDKFQSSKDFIKGKENQRPDLVLKDGRESVAFSSGLPRRKYPGNKMEIPSIEQQHKSGSILQGCVSSHAPTVQTDTTSLSQLAASYSIHNKKDKKLCPQSQDLHIVNQAASLLKESQLQESLGSTSQTSSGSTRHSNLEPTKTLANPAMKTGAYHTDTLSNIASKSENLGTQISLSQLATKHGNLTEACSSSVAPSDGAEQSKSFSLSALASAHSRLKPLGLSDHVHPPEFIKSTDLHTKQETPISLSELAAKHSTPPNYLAGLPGQNSTVPNRINLPELAFQHNTQPDQNKSSYAGVPQRFPITSLSELAAQHNTPPQPISLSELAAQHGTPPQPISLSELAAQHGTPPNTSSLPEPLKSRTSAPTLSSFGVSAKQGTPPPSFSLSAVAAELDASHKMLNTPSLTTNESSKPDDPCLSQIKKNYPSSIQNTPTLSDLASGYSPSSPSLSELAAGYSPTVPKWAELTRGTNPQTIIKGPDKSDGFEISQSDDHKSKGILHPGAKTPSIAIPGIISLDNIPSKPGYPSGPLLGWKPQDKLPRPPPGFSLPPGDQGIALPHRPPPGFLDKSTVKTGSPTKTPPGFPVLSQSGSPGNAFCLSMLAAQHADKDFKARSPSHTVITPKEILEMSVPSTKPSLFARVLCNSSVKTTSGISVVTKPKSQHKSKFSYHKQNPKIEKPDTSQQFLDSIKAFDFSTPSNDDIVKKKQKAAFGNVSGRSQISHTSAAAAAPNQVVDDKKPQLAPHMIRSMSAPDFTKGVARMTFSTNKQTKTGFEGPSAEASTKDDSAVRASSQEPSSGDTVMETPKKNMLNAFNQPSSNSKSASKPREKFDVKKEYENRKAGGKDIVNLVVIGHVDAGKSTLMGHVLYQLGFVNKRVMHKYEQEAKKIGKASFAYAWVLDETEEERSRGVTMDVAQTRFETENKLINLLDAPGHKDFIPNMITGAAQADVAVLVVNATRGEFETGFEMGGQTREHAMLIRSLGVSQLIVAVNKMDTVEWSQARFEEITKKLGVFLKQAGFKEADVIFIPCSGLIGENLTKPSDCAELKAWYTGPYLTEQIDKLRPPERPIDKPLRLCVADIFKGQGAGFSVSGTVQAGFVQAGDRVLVMPQGELATVKGIVIEDLPNLVAFAGDNIVMTLTGIEMNNIGIGSIVCDRAEPITACTRFKARVVIFNIDVPITKGFPVLVHYQSLTEPAVIKRLHSLLHKSTGEVVKSKPRCLVKNNSALVELEVSRPICLELYKNYKDLGRFMLRYSGHTIAAGLVTEIVKK